MKQYHILILIVSLIYMPACINSRAMSARIGKTEIHFGRTGGFTNIPVEYLLNSKGEVLRLSAKDTETVNLIPPKQLKSIIRELNRIDFRNIDLDEPGNISYFIKVKTAEYENTVRWNDLTPNDTVKNLYKQLLTTLRPDL